MGSAGDFLYGKLHYIAPPSKQLKVDRTAAVLKSLHEEPEFMQKPIRITGINSNLNGVNSNVIQSQTD